MAVTTQMRTQVAQLYVSLFGRAPEAEGLSYWAKQLEAGKSFQTIAQDMFNVAPARDYYPSTLTNQEIVAKFYQNVLGRPADAQGLAYWTARLNTESTTGTAASKAIAVGTVVTEMLTAVANYSGTDADAIKSQSLLANKVSVALYYGVDKADDAKIQAALVDKMATVAKDVIAMVVPGATGADAAKAYANPTHIFTLTESYAPGTEGSAGTKVVYWGYNPIAAGNSGTGAPSTGGIPVEDLKAFLLTITGLDLKELGLIDADGKDPFQNVTNLTLSNPLTSGANTNGSGGGANQSSGNTLTISFADGTSLNAEVKLGEAYFKFLSDLLFDKNGNTRLFEKVIGATSGTEASLQPIKLTPATNNGGTLEDGYTTLGDDVIVAGRLELLHQAYIDGGAGFNVLEIDAKGTYAQPTQLLNIQEIRVTDLPNFYTTPYGNGDGNLENTNTNSSGFPVPSGTQTTNDSWIDLSRATALGNTVNGVKGKLIVTDQSSDSGNLTIVGVRNGATLRLEGNFGGGSTTIQYGVGQTGTLNMELAVGDVTAPINVLQNASSLNIDSQGIENHFHTFFAGGSVSNMTIKGTGAFGVDQDLFPSFNAGRPAVINASANTGGLDVTLNNHYNVKITGTAADDEITTNYTSATGNVKSVIVAGNGDNTINANNSSSALTNISITSGTGNDVINATNNTTVVISAGDGNNTIIADSNKPNANISVTSGTGNDVIQVLTTETSGTAVVIDAGNGNNKVTVSGADVSVTTGTGNDTVTINGTNNTFLNGDNNGNDNNTGDFQGVISSSGVALKVDLGAGTNTLNLGRLSAGVVALEGSSITGSNITMFVENNSDLREATLSGITKVIMKQELTITDDQFKAIGANVFSAWHASFGATEDLRIVVDSNVVLTDLLNGKDLSANVRLNFELHNGATLTLTAEQLHKYVAVGGINGADGLNGKVIINQAGANFDPFQSGSAYLVIDGGTISAGNLYGAEDVTIIRDGSYERPTTGPLQDTMTLGSTTATADLTVANLVTEAQVLKLVGSQNINFTGVVDLGGEVTTDANTNGKDDTGGQTVNGTANAPSTNPGAVSGVESDKFSVDFSAVTGKVSGLTLDHFQDVSSIRGNGQAGNRIDVIMNADVGTSGINKGLNTSGVETFMVKRIDVNQDGVADSASTLVINLCDLTKDVKFIGLKGNAGNTLVLKSVPWGAVAPHIVLEGDGYANASDALKVDGSPNFSDVGSITAEYFTSGAPAVVDINNGGVELGTTATGGERKFKVGTITLTNASSATVNVAQGDAGIASIAGSSLTSLKFVATEDVSVTQALPTTLSTINASGVTGKFSATLNDTGSHGFTFTGSTGGTTLTLNGVNIDHITESNDNGSTINGGTGGAFLVIAADSDLAFANLSNIKGIYIPDSTALTLSMAQVSAIGVGVISTDTNGAATLNLVGLSNQPFAVANFNDGITIGSVELAAVPVITLDPTTDLTGVNSLVVPEGTTLNLTAAQFLQLTSHAITGLGTVNITGLTQADIDADGAFDLSHVSAHVGSITLKESVALENGDSLGFFKVVNMGDNMSLSLPSIAMADGLKVNGGANSALIFTQTAPAGWGTHIDASGFHVTTLKVLTQAIAGYNIDSVFTGLASSVTKEIYNDLGHAGQIDQIVTIDAGTSVAHRLIFNPASETDELHSLTLNLKGGVAINGDIVVDMHNKPGLLTNLLDSITINSTGTAENLLSHNPANIIGGALTSQAAWGGNTNNNLLKVNINADQTLQINGGIVFESVDDGSSFTTYDTAATATVNVTGTKNVSLGELNTGSDQVDALVVNNAGTGKVYATLNAATLDQTPSNNDKLSFTGSNINLKIAAGGGLVDLSDDVLTGVSGITIDGNSSLTLTAAQFNTLGVANLFPDANSGTTAHLNIVGLGSTVLDVSTLANGIVIDTVSTASGTVTLNPATNLTGVLEIRVPEGSTLTLTAAQFQQLKGKGTITSIDTNGDLTAGKFYLNITDLKNADVQADDSANPGGSAGFSLDGVQNNAVVTVSLGESTVTLGKYDSAGALSLTSDLLVGSLTANTVEFKLTANQTLKLVDPAQADKLKVSGDATNTLIMNFDWADFATSPYALPTVGVDASKYIVGVVKTLSTAAANNDVEVLFKNLASSVTLNIFHDPLSIGYISSTNRVAVVEAGVTVPGLIMFNDMQAGKEVVNLSLTLQGGNRIEGDLGLTTTTPTPGKAANYFNTLTINSQGTVANETVPTQTDNVITGNITATPTVSETGTIQNNLLNVVVNASQNLVVGGDIVFSVVNTLTSNKTANLTLTGASNVTVEQLDLSDNQISNLVIANNGTGTFTATGASPAIFDTVGADVTSNLKTMTLSGTGNIVFGSNPNVTTEWGISAANLSKIDASLLKGDLNLGEIRDIKSDGNFTFTAGTGVTKLTLKDATGLNSVDGTSADDLQSAKWKFDMGTAKAGSELHLGTNVWGDGADLADDFTSNGLEINLGSNTTLYIDANTDFTLLDTLLITGTGAHSIVLKDGVTLTLTAAQANGLHIVAGADLNNDGLFGTVNIVGLGDVATDLSGIASNIAGTITLEDNDVTVHASTNLGSNFTIVLNDLNEANPLTYPSELSGQTIRFSTAEQAANKIRVDAAYATGTGGDGDTESSTNVVWLFDSVTGPVNTNGYDAELGRLWFKEKLVNNNNVENLFTTLPSTIVRVDFHALSDLDVLLNSNGVSRVIELASFTSLPLGVSFNDKDRLEHVQSLDIRMGGQVTVGNIEIDNLVVPAAGVDPASIHFDSLIVRSVLADDTGDLLARVGFSEAAHVKPTAANKVGNISVGTSQGLDLKDVTLLTGVALSANNKSATHTGPAYLDDVLTGNNLEVGSIIFDAEPAVLPATNTATLHLDGANNVTLKSMTVTDVDFAAAMIDLSDVTGATGGGMGYAGGTDGSVGFSGTLTITGASPAIQLNAVAETLTFNGDAVSHNTKATITLGSNDLLGKVVNAGVSGAELSNIVVTNYDGTLNLGTISMLDGTDDVAEGGDKAAYDGPSEAAFTFVAGAGVTTATLAKVGAETPTLKAGSHWFFNYNTAAAGSYLAFGDGLVLEAGSFLSLTNVPLVIEKSIDLTQITLTMTSAQGIEVKAGQVLTLTPAQADALNSAGVDIFGAGTVKLVGDASDLALGANLHTAVVDLATATLAAALADANPLNNALTITLGDANTGSIGGAAVAAGIQVIGSANDDAITLIGTKDSAVAGNGGNDTIDTIGLGASTTHTVTAGVDTIKGLTGEVGTAPTDQHDVLIVSAGATANATLINDISSGVTGFVATAATVNNGTVNLTVQAGHAASKVDMHLATGAKGYTLTGSTDNATGTDNLIGSAFADIINGGNTDQAAGAIDTMTGNGGADVFEFNVGTSIPRVMSTVTATPGRDIETLTVNESAVADATLLINYTVNGVAAATPLNVAVLNGNTAAVIATKIAAAFSAAGFTATALGGALQVEGVNGSSISLDGYIPGAADADDVGTPFITFGTPVVADVAQVQTVTIGTPGQAVVPGEKYSVSIVIAGGSTATTFSYPAVFGDTTDTVAAALSALINPDANVNSSSALNVITITDGNADNGGFTTTFNAQGGFSGSGASEIGALTIASADIITDFLSGTDKIDLNLTAGSVTNYAEAAGVANYALALTAADTALNGVVQYYLTSVNESAPGAADGYGVLFFDANGDGTVDGVVKLLGITSANFTHTDIIA